MTPMHYCVEPPSSYGLIPNITIAGEGVLAFMLLVATIWCLKQRKEIAIDGTIDSIEQETLLLNESNEKTTRHRSPRRLK